jgi:ATP-binding cassette subfamily B protein
MILRIGFRAPVSLLIAIALAFFISPRMTGIYFIVVVFLSIFLVFVLRRASGYFREVFSRYDDLNASVQENVSAIRVVKSFVREEYENDKFRKAVGNLYQVFVRAEKLVVSNMPVMMGSIYTCILLLSWFGAKMITAGDLTTGQLMSLLAYCMTILMNLMMVSILFVMFTMSEASMDRIAEVLKEEITLTNPENPDMVVPDGSIRFEHVMFSYNENAEKPVLDDINLEIRAGETIGIIGGTGSSKSSLVNLIQRLYDVTGGAVYVGGKDVRRYDLDTLRREVAVVLQANVLFSGTVLENLRWGDPDATDEECMEACRLACADEFVRNLPEGYHTHIEQGGTNVSGGQRQRLCIARALLKKPKVLILDDSTSAVDTATDAKIQAAFREKIPDTTRLIIAQRISSVEHADRIIVLEEGRVDGVGTHEELLRTNEIYRDVYESQIKGSGDFDKGGED